MDGVFGRLAGSFLKIGLLGFGGGVAMLPLVQHEVVDVHGWTTPAGFADMVALSETTPGPIIVNAATFLGFTAGAGAGAADAGGGAGLSPAAAGLAGSILATLCVCLPPLVLMLGTCAGFGRVRGHPRVKASMAALRPVVIGLIAAAAALLAFAPGNLSGWGEKAIFAGVLVAGLAAPKLHPLWMLAAAGGAGAVLF